MRYRPDIDGLRTVAVLPVLLFHYGLLGVQGGFVGVDIFFVISGYLITGLLAADIRAGRFSYWDFYERRFRRILPAFFLMLAVTIGVGWWVLTPSNMSHFGAELYNSTYFSTNFLYFRKDGYFDGASSLRLLLHSWSLSVEEQFYLLVPFLLVWAVRRQDRPESWRSTRIFILLTGLSLAVAVLSVWKFPSAAYYLLPSRAWELLLGSVLALGHVPKLPARPVRQALGAAALLLILVPCFGYSSLTPFPGLAAVPPCLGAALLIWLGSDDHGRAGSYVHVALRWSPMVGLGKLSYALYLWHWPILVLFRHYQMRDPDDLEAWAALALALILSLLSYWLVEQPIRRRHILGHRRTLFVACGAAMVAVFVFGKLARDSGFPHRYTPEAQRYASYAGSQSPRQYECRNRTLAQVQAGDVCRYGQERPGAPDFIVWGDSHAESLLTAFDAVAQQRNVWGLHVSFGSCPPLPGVTVTTHMRGGLACDALNNAARELIQRSGAKKLVLVARWAMYAEPFPKLGTDARVNKVLHLTDSQSQTVGWEENRAVIARSLQHMLHDLKSRNMDVFITQPLPETWFEVPQTLAMASRLGRDRAELMIPWSEVQERQARLQSLFEALQQQGLMRVIPTHPALCQGERCMIEKDGIPLYRDGTHLSLPGALHLLPQLDDIFGQTRNYTGEPMN